MFVELHEMTGALRESEERFRTAFADAPIGIALLAPDGRIGQVNRALCDAIGRSQADLIGAGLDQLSDGSDAEAVGRMLAGNLPSHHVERRLQHSDGHALQVLLTMSPTMGAEGEPVGVIVQVVDLTQRSRAERERSERLREQGAREQAEAVADTIRKLQSVADVALAHLALDELLEKLCEQVSGVFEADCAAIMLASSEGEPCGWPRPPASRPRSWRARRSRTARASRGAWPPAVPPGGTRRRCPGGRPGEPRPGGADGGASSSPTGACRACSRWGVATS